MVHLVLIVILALLFSSLVEIRHAATDLEGIYYFLPTISQFISLFLVPIWFCNFLYLQEIDWDALFARALKPPFVPSLRAPTDISNFDEEFTSQKPILTPPDELPVLTPEEQAAFKDFDFVSRHLLEV